MSNYLLISDAAKEVCVESHVLRYWEEELRLPIKRNELGHRYYTNDDVERFKQIKNLKERGLQLKAIKMILKDGKLDVIPHEDAKLAIDIVNSREDEEVVVKQHMLQETVMQPEESREEKAKRLQWILQQMIRQTLQENNQELCREVKETLLKELDYQFRVKEERDEERDRLQAERNEKYYQKMDELLRKKSRKQSVEIKKEKRTTNMDTKELEAVSKVEATDKKEEKKKRHFIF